MATGTAWKPATGTSAQGPRTAAPVLSLGPPQAWCPTLSRSWWDGSRLGPVAALEVVPLSQPLVKSICLVQMTGETQGLLEGSRGPSSVSKLPSFPWSWPHSRTPDTTPLTTLGLSVLSSTQELGDSLS